MILLDQIFWEIKTTEKKGRGIFTRKEISPGIVIGDYIGKVIKTAEEDTSEKNGLYLLYYHDYASIYPEDLNKTGIHMINHSCAPNCWIYTFKGHTLFFTLRKIFPGEELTISYQLSPNDFCNPCTHICICGSTFCSGTMHLSKEQFNTWNAFNETEARKTKRAGIRYGRLLPKLKFYPQRIPDHPIYTLFGNAEKAEHVLHDDKLPSLSNIRKHIRSTGRTLVFSKLQTRVLGVKDNELVMKSY